MNHDPSQPRTEPSPADHADEPASPVGLATLSGVNVVREGTPGGVSPLPVAAGLLCVGLFIVIESRFRGFGFFALVAPVLLFSITVAVRRSLHTARTRAELGPTPSDQSGSPKHVGGLEVRPVADDSRRVWCVGETEELRGVMRHGPIEDASFDPIAFPIWKVPRRPVAIATWIGVTIAAAVAAYASVQWAYGARAGLLAALFGAPPVGSVAAAWIFRRYVRLTPGRYELLSFPALGSGRPVIERIDLRGRRVMVDLRRWTILIIERPGGRPRCVEFTDAESRDALAHAVLRAAASTANVPDLPDDALIG